MVIVQGFSTGNRDQACQNVWLKVEKVSSFVSDFSLQTRQFLRRFHREADLSGKVEFREGQRKWCNFILY